MSSEDHHPASAPGNIGDAALELLVESGRRTTAEHTQRVAAEALRLAGIFGVDSDRAATAAWLHDISAIHDPGEYVALAAALGLAILPEEREYPGVLHQRMSSAIAHERFLVEDQAVLTAISCHTTLRAGASDLDMVLYAADKLSWDRADAAPFEADMRSGLTVSLRAGVLVHLRWLHGRRAALAVVHPWLREAYEWLSGTPW